MDLNWNDRENKAIKLLQMSVNVYQTIRCNIPENSHFHSSRRENLKGHNENFGQEACNTQRFELDNYRWNFRVLPLH
jgi:hypothetical protein